MGLRDRTRTERIVRERQPITADTALRLARVSSTSAQYRVNLQSAHDPSVAAIAGPAELEHIRPIAAI